MSNPSTILVTGASGHLGRLIVSEMLSANAEGGEGHNIIAASRDISKLNELGKLGAELRTLDLDSFELTKSAFQGVDVVVLVSTAEFQRRIVQHRTALRAAEATGVHHVLYTSFVNPRPENGLFHDHFFTEHDLVQSRLNWTILRNNSYAETLFLTLPKFIRGGIFPAVSLDGRKAYISRLDCASLTAAVALNAHLYNRQVIDVSADVAYSPQDVANIASKVLNHPLKVVPLPISEYIAKLRQDDIPEWWCNISGDIEYATANGAFAITNGGKFKKIVGRDPMSLEMFISNNKDFFLATEPLPP